MRPWASIMVAEMLMFQRATSVPCPSLTSLRMTSMAALRSCGFLAVILIIDAAWSELSLSGDTPLPSTILPREVSFVIPYQPVAYLHQFHGVISRLHRADFNGWQVLRPKIYQLVSRQRNSTDWIDSALKLKATLEIYQQSKAKLACVSKYLAIVIVSPPPLAGRPLPCAASAARSTADPSGGGRSVKVSLPAGSPKPVMITGRAGLFAKFRPTSTINLNLQTCRSV